MNGNPYYVITLLIAVIAFHYVYFYFLHRVYGAKLDAEVRSKRKLSFKTNKSKFQLDSERRKLIFKNKRDKHWKTIHFDEMRNIRIERTTNTASVIEFFFGDFSLFDFFRKYRDQLHTYKIILSVFSTHADMNMDVTILTLKQYEQREFFLGKLMHNFDIWLMTKFGFYMSIDDVSENKVEEIMLLSKSSGIELNFAR